MNDWYEWKNANAPEQVAGKGKSKEKMRALLAKATPEEGKQRDARAICCAS